MIVSKSVFNTKFIGVLFLIISISIISCSPNSKESYLKQYNDFITEIMADHQTYTAENWRDLERKNDKFTGEWYDKYKNEFSIKDKIIVTKNKVQFNIYKMNYDTKITFGYDLSKDYDKLRKQIKYYSENEMDDDLETLIDQAKKMGGELEESVNEILEELNYDSKNQE